MKSKAVKTEQGSAGGTRQCRRNKAVQAEQGGARCNKSVPRETRQNKRSFRENYHERKGKLEKTK